jgi:TetR/AcrR family transcriptional regulator
MSDGSSMRREQRKSEQRRRIQDSARDVFFRDGFVAANLDEVAEGAGVAKGTLYRYFDSKAELYVAVLSQDGQSFADKMRESVEAPDLAPPEMIRRLARFYFEHWRSHAQYFQIFWALENQPVIGELPKGVVDEVSRLWETCLSILAEVVERGVAEGFFRPVDPWVVADILWTLSNGIIQAESNPAHQRLRKRDLQQTFEDAVDLVLAGLAPSTNAG